MGTKLLTMVLSAGLAGALSLPLAGAQAPQPERVLTLTFHEDGLVTLVARQVTVRDILAEWTRLGGSRFSNAEKLTGGPIAVEYDRQPETKVLESLLRSAAGYLLAPRLPGDPGASHVAMVHIVPTSQPTSAAFSSPIGGPSPVAAPVTTPGSPDDEIPPVRPLPTTDASAQTPPNQPPRPTIGVPGVFVPIVPVTNPPTTGRGGEPPPPPPPPGGAGS